MIETRGPSYRPWLWVIVGSLSLIVGGMLEHRIVAVLMGLPLLMIGSWDLVVAARRRKGEK